MLNGFVIFGYYGYGNLGDETNLRELVALIRSNYSTAHIHGHIIRSRPNRC